MVLNAGRTSLRSSSSVNSPAYRSVTLGLLWPASFIGSQLRGIVGVEIAITAIHGKWKVSQDEPEIDRKSVSKGLSKDNPVMSELVGLYGKIQEDKE